MHDLMCHEASRCLESYEEALPNRHPESLFAATYYWCMARRCLLLVADDRCRDDIEQRLSPGLPDNVLAGAGLGLSITLDATLRIVTVGGQLLYEEVLLVLTNAVSIEYVSEYLRQCGMLDAEAEAKIGELRRALVELAAEPSVDYKSALAQMRRVHHLRSAFLNLTDAEN
jgi:hypothetical protein